MDTGDGISYAMYFVVIIMGVFIFAFRIFHFDLLVLEETLENRLHVIESAVITSNQGSIIDGKRNDPYERELKRMHIILQPPVRLCPVQLCGRRHPGAESQRVIPAQTPGQTRCRKPRHGKCKTCFGGVL